MKKISSQQAGKMAITLAGVTTKDHFGGDAYCANKRIFATFWHEKNVASLRLSPAEQERFLELDGEAFSKIDNAWGRQGWTTVNLQYIEPEIFKESLISAWTFSAEKVKAANAKSKKKVSKKQPSQKELSTRKKIGKKQ